MSAGLLAALVPVIKLIFEAIFGVLLEKANEPTTMVDADRDAGRTARERERVLESEGNFGPAGPVG